MTKFDIRVRRKQFTQSRIERHKNYQSLMKRHYESGKRKTRGTMVLVFLLILIIAILLAFFNTPEKPKQESSKDKVSFNDTNLNNNKRDINTVYKL